MQEFQSQTSFRSDMGGRVWTLRTLPLDPPLLFKELCQEMLQNSNIGDSHQLIE